jgi:hypothetical protein
VTEPGSPPAEVLRAFDADADPRPLAAPTWLAGDIVLKPDVDERLQTWMGTEVAPLARDGFRLAEPLPARDGSWVVAGWGASRWVEGVCADERGAEPDDWRSTLEGGRAFHRAVAHVLRPSWLADQQSWWAVADRRAWGEARPTEPVPELLATARVLEDACRPLGDPQVVHADLGGNVLLADGLPPAVIDVSPYWRPPAYAEGILVADALCWSRGEADLVDTLGVSVPAVARGLLFRLWTTHERVTSNVEVEALPIEAQAYANAASALGLGG